MTFSRMDMDETLAIQREAFMAALPEPLSARKDRLKRAAAMIRDNAASLCDAMSQDFGHRSREQSMTTDIEGSIGPLESALKNLDTWARPERRKVTFPLGLLGAKAWIKYQPKGVIGVIAPWNFPLNLIFSPLAEVFAAGNRAMIKTSEYTPATGALLEELVQRSFAVEELAVVGGGVEAGQAFASLPFDHLVFTGGTAVGRHVMRAAADNLVPVTLELGGKSPVIIGKGADLPRATERIALGKMLNAGQICLAPDYLLVREEDESAVVEGLTAAASAMYPTLVDNPDYTSMVSDRHLTRLGDWLDDARSKGAQIETVNPAGEDFTRGNGRKMPLHIVRDATDDMILMQEEIFGPVLPIRRYSSIDDAITQVNRRDRPLALYHFGSDESERRRVLDRTISGGVTLDDVIFHVAMESLPFGGVGPSGMGAYHGEFGFKAFSHARGVYRQARIDVARLARMKPPYRKR
jgi:coniferyl-aldehyde dehydrogenase